MPELPEVETIKLELEKDIVGKKIQSIEILTKKQFIGNPDQVIWKKINAIKRVGKYLSIEIDNLFLNIHLKMTGQLLFAKNMNNPVFENEIPFSKTNKMPGKTTRVIITFSDKSGLFFNDMRKFGWIKISSKPEIPKGMDVLSKDFTLDYFRKLIKPIQPIFSKSKPIKQFLMDQDKISGIGNIYANEALFYAKISPQRKSKSLNEKEIELLFNAINQVIKKGIKYKGSSAADEAYITPDGKRGSMQDHFKVYQQEGKICPNNCKGSIKRIKQERRSSFYCPKCQK